MEYSRSLSRLQRLCSKAEYCRADIYRKALKDLDGDAAEAARLVDESSADARLQRLLASKAKTLEGDPQFRLKLIKFGLSRGYEYSKVEDALAFLTNKR